MTRGGVDDVGAGVEVCFHPEVRIRAFTVTGVHTYAIPIAHRADRRTRHGGHGVVGDGDRTTETNVARVGDQVVVVDRPGRVDGDGLEIGRAHGGTPVTVKPRMRPPAGKNSGDVGGRVDRVGAEGRMTRGG